MSFLQNLLSNSPTYSFGRFLALMCASFCLGWDTSNLVFAWHFNHHLPPGMAPLDLLPSATALAAQGAFMSLSYGITKYGDIRTASTGGNTPPQP